MCTKLATVTTPPRRAMSVGERLFGVCRRALHRHAGASDRNGIPLLTPRHKARVILKKVDAFRDELS